mgnify:CR=1 FL=1
MEVRLVRGELKVSHRLKKSETWKISESESFKTISIFQKPILVNGLSNATEDGQYVLFIDYDNVSKEIVMEDTERLIREYNLPSFYLFTTKEKNNIGNYHLINLMKLNYEEIIEILSKCRCDNNYKSMNLRNVYKSWVLRISIKDKRSNPKFLKAIPSIFEGTEISKAHLDFLNKIYKLPKYKYTNLDGGSMVKIHQYETFR